LEAFVLCKALGDDIVAVEGTGESGAVVLGCSEVLESVPEAGVMLSSSLPFKEGVALSTDTSYDAGANDIYSLGYSYVIRNEEIFSFSETFCPLLDYFGKQEVSQKLKKKFIFI
jgi:hypothetical protein